MSHPELLPITSKLLPIMLQANSYYNANTLSRDSYFMSSRLLVFQSATLTLDAPTCT